MPLHPPRRPVLLLLLLVCQLVCNRTFDKYSCWPDTPPNTTANISCPWYLPWHHKVQHRFVFKRCGPDGQWVRGPRGQPWRNASQCQIDGEEIEVQKEAAKMYSGFQMMYTVGYSLSLGALLLALALLGGLSKLHCTRNAIHANLFASFVLKAGSVLVIDGLLRTRYSQKIGDDLSVSIWLSDGVSPPRWPHKSGWAGGQAARQVATLTLHLCQAVAGCRVAAVFMHYGIVANYCWLLVEGLYLHSLLGLATLPERSFFRLYLGIGWGAPMLFVIPWVVVKCLFENIQCWTSNDNMGFWWILRFPVFLAILINLFIFIRVVHLLVAKLRARQMHHTDYKFRLAKSTLTLIPLLGVHEVVFAFVTDEHAQGTLRSAKLFFDLFLSSFQVPARPPAPPPGAQRATPDHSLSPGPAGGCPLLLPQQGGAVRASAALAPLAPGQSATGGAEHRQPQGLICGRPRLSQQEAAVWERWRQPRCWPGFICGDPLGRWSL
uniref:Glucagon receptor n=1 Tax=Aotus nancymaae TaxID=37293 RepID=A0A2K5EN21_AOTNA